MLPLDNEQDEEEMFISIAHPMTKAHNISFIAYVKDNRADIAHITTCSVAI